MVQLKVYPNINKIQSQQVFLDLYDTVPIKLTLSIEDITDADATSVFSRTFKIPANAHNSNFFMSAFEINGVDYDVTIKKPAEILVDGQEFRQGHIRLQKIYVNEDLDKTDYELLFLGETRDFSTLIGDAPLCQLNMPDLYITDNAGTPINPTKEAIEDSWQAFPQSTSVDSNGNPNAGVNNGNILFPLIDFGNTYDEAGDLILSDVSIGNNNTTDKSFIHSAYPLNPVRLKPMIRAKRIWDQIFSDAGYTYTSNFVNSAKFHQMYVSAFGNDARVGYSVEENSNNVFSAENTESDGSGTNAQFFGDYLWLPDNIFDPGSNYTVGVNQGGSYYVAPGSALAGDASNKYTISAEAYVFAEREISCPGFCTDPVPGRLQLYNLTTGQVLKQSFPVYDGVASLEFDTELDNIGIGQGDVLFLKVEPTSSVVDFDFVHSIKWDITAAPGSLNPVAQLDCEYKQIDFIKDVLKMFRLVLAPDPAISNNFIVEPWQTYINSGDLHDWSHKLVQNKDQVLEPLFNTQSEEIEYRFQQDEDFINSFHFDQFKEPYGYLKFDSNNELLKGTRTVETIEIAPTPIGTIYEDIQPNGTHQVPGFILPLIHTNEAEDTGNQRLPIKPKTRFLFYNGLVPVPTTSNGTQYDWYLGTPGNVNGYDEYPLVSPFENWPQTSEGLNLNWANDVNYWLERNTTTIFDTPGRTLFDDFWSRYISSLYGKFTRRLTAYFILNNVDLQTFSFDDTIFVNGVYYRPEKIIDVNIGERTEVKVQLITSSDFKPAVHLDDTLTNFSVTTTNEVCGCDGIISVTTDGATPFTWLLSNGQSGQVQTTGGNPQSFDIPGICAGSFTLTVTDDLGRSNTTPVTIGQNTGSPVSATFTTQDATNCAGGAGACNGEIDVTPAGGQSPYTITWEDTTVSGLNPTGLCPNDYRFYITDANGCQSDLYEASVGCGGASVWLVRRLLSNCSAIENTPVHYVQSGSVAVGDVVSLTTEQGCWQIIQDAGSVAPDKVIDQIFSTCADCTGVTPPQKWEIQECTGQNVKWLLATDYPNLTVGMSVTITGSTSCWEVHSIDNNNNTNETVDQVFSTCADCDSGTPFYYIIESCSGEDPDAPPPIGGQGPLGGLGAGQAFAIAPLDLTQTNSGWGGTTDICEAQALAKTLSPASGWYYSKPIFYITNLVDLPADTKIALVRTTNTVPYPITDILYTFTYSDYATLSNGDTNSFTLTTPASYYLDGTQSLAWVVHRDDGQPGVAACSPTNVTSAAIDHGPYVAPTQQPMATAQWFFLGNNPTGPAMEADGPLNIGDVVQVNELQGCYTIASETSGIQIDYTYNSDGGVFATCADCTGGEIQQNCHDIAATNTPTVFTYTYDDGTGIADQSITLNAGQTDTICATINSVSITTGAGTFTDLGTTCFKTTWGTSCDTQPQPSRECYTFTGALGPGTNVSRFEWFEDNVAFSVKLKPGQTYQACADVNTPQLTYGGGTINASGDSCTDITDCVTTCYNYLFEGPKGLDLLYVECDGTIGYIADVAVFIDNNIGTIPVCISKITGGSAERFLTQTTTCT